METRKVTAADLRGPEGSGPHRKLGSLVLENGQMLRVEDVQPSVGTINITFVEERGDSAGGTTELVGPLTIRRNVVPATAFELVIEDD